MQRLVTIKTFNLFCGLGAGMKGMNAANPTLRSGGVDYRADFDCLGGIDNVSACIDNFRHLVGVAGTVMDLFSREQFVDWFGRLPPADWREATPDDIRAAARGQFPDIIFLSPPCKGFSGLLNPKQAQSVKYRALNSLTLRGLYLSLEAFKEDLPSFIALENVPRIEALGADFLEQMTKLLGQYGYAVTGYSHDLGAIGGLAQKRNRYLLVARNTAKIPNFLYQPAPRPHKTIGDVLEKLPLPGDPRTGKIHDLPNLAMKTWLRLAMIEPGKDWRSLNRLQISTDGMVQDYALVPDTQYQSGVLGVREMSDTSGVVAGRSGPTNGAYSVADPRLVTRDDYLQYGVRRLDMLAPTITSQRSPGQGPFSIADPRPFGGVSSRPQFRNGGHYGVCDPSLPSYTITASGKYDNGFNSVSDPRVPAPNEKVKCVIRTEWDTWHRPFTTYECAALQNLFDPEEGIAFELVSGSHTSWREMIGNAVPPSAAQAMGHVMGKAILMANAETSVDLSSMPVWVRPHAIAMSVQQPVHPHAIAMSVQQPVHVPER